jgi:hypothetical protein
MKSFEYQLIKKLKQGFHTGVTMYHVIQGSKLHVDMNWKPQKSRRTKKYKITSNTDFCNNGDGRWLIMINVP